MQFVNSSGRSLGNGASECSGSPVIVTPGFSIDGAVGVPPVAAECMLALDELSEDGRFRLEVSPCAPAAVETSSIAAESSQQNGPSMAYIPDLFIAALNVALSDGKSRF